MAADDNKPKWDVALASLANDVYRRKGERLSLDDFHDLAREHSIRLDDIMETIFLLSIHGQWTYFDSAGKEQPLDQATLDCAKGILLRAIRVSCRKQGSEARPGRRGEHRMVLSRLFEGRSFRRAPAEVRDELHRPLSKLARPLPCSRPRSARTT